MKARSTKTPSTKGKSTKRTSTRPLPLVLTMLGLVTGILSGCGSEERVDTVSVFANANCKGVTSGLSEVSLADVARFRGSQLVVPDTATDDGSNEPMPLLIALSRGVQPSRGFELHLSDQARVTSPTRLAIDVYWSEPDLSKPQPLTGTTPCLVVSVPPGPWQTIEAIDQHGESLGTLTRRSQSDSGSN